MQNEIQSVGDLYKKNIDSQSHIQSSIHIGEKQLLPEQILSVPASLSHQAYRPDIDGLRAVAVSIVVIFHAWPSYLSGGYIGVDIFFVISGYLISQILIKQNLKEGNYFPNYIYNFYNRRVKRIYPALIALLIFVLVFGSLNLKRTDLQSMSKTMAASTVFSANLYILYQKSGYFQLDTKANPLLHLWSLGVQQQFYIIWPILIYLLLRKSKGNDSTKLRNRFTIQSSNVMTLLIVFTMLSMMMNVEKAIEDTKFDFYFPLCRFWQMSIGGILAYKYQSRLEGACLGTGSTSILQQLGLHQKIIINIISAGALLTIFLTSYLLPQKCLYPGWLALLPTLATACIIQCGHSSPSSSSGQVSQSISISQPASAYSMSLVNRYVLSNRLIQFVGKVSYSFYLWHWPLLVFSRLVYPYGSTAVLAQTYVIVIIAFVMSVLSYYLVENTLRFRKEKAVLVGLLIVMGIIGVAAMAVYYKAPSITGEYWSSEFDKQAYQSGVDDGKEKNDGIFNTNQTINQSNRGENIKVRDKYKNGKLDQSDKMTKMAKFDRRIKNDKANAKSDDPFWEQYYKDLKPTQQDMVYINQGNAPIGLNITKRMPNLSKNRNRIPTTADKIYINVRFPQFMHIFDEIDQTSKFYRPAKQLPAYIRHYEIINPGRDKLVLLFGDSHAHVASWRYLKLYEDATAQDRLHEMPTMVLILLAGTLLIPFESNYPFLVRWVEQFKPDRILFVYHWQNWYQDGGWSPKRTGKRGQQYYYNNVQYFIALLANLTKSNIDVTVATWQPYGQPIDPRKMLDQNRAVRQPPLFISYSQFKAQHFGAIYFLQNQVKKAGGHIIDFSDNMCWNDTCEGLTSKGLKIFYDTNHLGYEISREWLSVLDFLVEP